VVAVVTSPLVGGLLGAVAAIGVVIAVAAWVGALDAPAAALQQRAGRIDQLLARTGLAVAAGGLAWWWTGWIAAAAALAWLGWVAPSLAGVRTKRRREIARSEAVAVWAEMLRDLLLANAGVREAIGKTARVAPPPIADEVRALEVRAQRGELAGALQRFAADLDDPIADTVIVALLLAERRSVSNLSGMLSAVATSTRETVAMQLRVNATRARTYRTSQMIAGVVAFFTGLLLVTNRDYMKPFGTLTGQLVLIGVTAVLAVAVGTMLALSRPARAPRLLRVDAVTRSRRR
jgi:tight adherence protein B